MPKSEHPGLQSPLPRPSRYPYWVLIPLCAVAYTVFCLAFTILAWGMDSESEPWWYVVIRVLALPGMWSPRYISGPLWGGMMGFGLIGLIRLTQRIRNRRPPAIPPRL